MDTKASLIKAYGIYIAHYCGITADGVTQKEAVLGLWHQLHLRGIEIPQDFVLRGELHEQQLKRIQR